MKTQIGILSSLLYLRGEAMNANMVKTQELLKLSCDAFFADLEGVDTINRDLEKIKLFLSQIETLGASELSILISELTKYNSKNYIYDAREMNRK